MDDLFRISPEVALRVVVTTVTVYLAFIVLVRVLGQRTLTTMSSFDYGCVVALGAVLGRTVLLRDPTLMIGIVALSTFFVLQAGFGLLRQWRPIDRLMNRRPILLVADGELLRANLVAAHVVEDEIRQAVRRAGLHGLDEVQWLVLESNGTLSVVDRTRTCDPWLTDDVVGGR